MSDANALTRSKNLWLLRRIALAGALFSLGVAALYAALESPLDSVGAAGCTVVCTWSYLITPRARQRRRVVHLSVGAFVVIFSVCLSPGLIAYSAWLGLASLIAFLGMGRRAGLAWTVGILLAMAAALAFRAWSGADLSQGSVAVRVLRVLVLVPTLAMLATS